MSTLSLVRRRDRGATLVETAVVIPMLIMLAIGLSEVAFLVIDQMSVANAAREGARVGSAAGPYVSGSINADTLILRSVEQAVCHIETGAVDRVYIYKAASDGAMPADPNLINEYSPPVSGVLNCTAAGTTSFTCTNSCPWSVTGRDNQLPGLDSLGVRVEFTHTPVLGLFPFSGDMSLADRAVMRIEPDTRG